MCPKYGTPQCDPNGCLEYFNKSMNPDFGIMTEVAKTTKTIKDTEKFKRVIR
jgi:hypothetical protein